MKKLLFCLVIILGTTSCTIEDNGAVVFEKKYTINTREWQKSVYADEAYFYCEISERELTEDMYYNGSFSAFALRNIDGFENLTPLPYDIYDMNSNSYRWTTQYTCEFSPGFITFIVKVNDFVMDNYPPTMSFVVKYIR